VRSISGPRPARKIRETSGPTILTLDDIPDGYLLARDGSLVAGVDPSGFAPVAVMAWKEHVRAATTANGTLATAFENGDTIDGVALATGDRILIKNQTSQDENGIYVVAASGAPTRATDANTAAELESAAVFVDEGTINKNTAWVQTTDNFTLGSGNVVFAQFDGGQLTAGAGLTRSGDTIDVGAGDGIQVNANDVTVKLDGATLTKGAGGLKVTNPAIGDIGCVAARVANFSIPNNTDTSLIFDTSKYDTDSMLDIGGAHPERIKFTTAGKYYLLAHMETLFSVGTDLWCDVALNGTKIKRFTAYFGHAGMALLCVFERQFAANDYIEFIFYQIAGGAADLGDEMGTGEGLTVAARRVA